MKALTINLLPERTMTNSTTVDPKSEPHIAKEANDKMDLLRRNLQDTLSAVNEGDFDLLSELAAEL